MPKVFLIGWNRTGTTSVGKALNMLGWKLLNWDDWFFENGSLTDELLDDLLHLRSYRCLDRYDGSDQCVIPVYRRVAEKYPDSKFILTIRDSESWSKSIISHQKWLHGMWKPDLHFRTFHKVITLGCYQVTEENKEACVAAYEEHNRSVIDFFENRERLLVMRPCEGDDWGKLCRFLGLPGRKEKFPWENSRESARKKR